MSNHTTWPTNTVFKVQPVVKGEYHPSDADGEGEVPESLIPRLLQPVANDTDLTTANGFTSANLRPGDMIMVADGTASNPQLLVRNEANNGWSVYNYDATLADS